MTQHYALECTGTVFNDPHALGHVPVCDTGWSVVAMTAPEFDPGDLDPALIAGAVGTGFFIMLPLWVAVLGGRKLLDAIR